MKLNYQESSVILIGGWNPSMLDASWLEEFIVKPMNNEGYNIKKANLQVLFENSFSIRDAPVLVSFGEFKILFSGIRLIFQLEEGKDFSILEKRILSLCDYLSFTPVSAFGVNFIFRSEENEDLDIVSRIADLNKSKFHSIVERYSFSINLNNIDTTIDLNIDKTENKFEFKINFNFNVRNSTEIKQRMAENPMNNLKKSIVDFLFTEYKVRIED